MDAAVGNDPAHVFLRSLRRPREQTRVGKALSGTRHYRVVVGDIVIQYIYVAGPITKGDQFLNIRNGISIGDTLLKEGFTPFVPHLTALWHMIHPGDYEDWMCWDLAWLDKCDSLLRLPGESTGADREVERAEQRGIPVFYLLDNTKRALRNVIDDLHEYNIASYENTPPAVHRLPRLRDYAVLGGA